MHVTLEGGSGRQGRGWGLGKKCTISYRLYTFLPQPAASHSCSQPLPTSQPCPLYCPCACALFASHRTPHLVFVFLSAPGALPLATVPPIPPHCFSIRYSSPSPQPSTTHPHTPTTPLSPSDPSKSSPPCPPTPSSPSNPITPHPSIRLTPIPRPHPTPHLRGPFQGQIHLPLPSPPDPRTLSTSSNPPPPSTPHPRGPLQRQVHKEGVLPRGVHADDALVHKRAVQPDLAGHLWAGGGGGLHGVQSAPGQAARSV